MIFQAGQPMTNSQPVVFVDLDGTLISEWTERIGQYNVMADWGPHRFELAPRANQFLQSLSSKARLILCTMGGDRYANEILNMTGLSGYFEDVISYEDIDSGSPVGEFELGILVDNDHGIAGTKIDHLNYAPSLDSSPSNDRTVVHVSVSTYMGKGQDGLDAALSEVFRLIDEWQAGK
jgi:hypothetical protein